MQIAVGKLAVVGAIAAAKTSSLDSYLKFVVSRVCDGSGLLSDQLVSCLRRWTNTDTPTNSGQCGMCGGR
jgi:hypothetical protein